MLALAVSVIFALYILGPDLFSRLILGFVVPRRVVPLTRGEEVSRAILWCVWPLTLSLLWAWVRGTLARLWTWENLKTCVAGLYSEQFFREHQGQWFHAADQFLWLNFALLWRIYLLLLILTVLFNVVIKNYAAIRRKLKNHPRCRKVLASIVLPRVASWHLILSGMLVPEKNLSIHVDVLTKSNILYQGRLEDRQLGADGALVSITLAEPRRFRRDQYLAHQTTKDVSKRSTKKVSSGVSGEFSNTAAGMAKQDNVGANAPEADEAAVFWKTIPTNMFIVMGGEISTINFRYVPEKKDILKDFDVASALAQVNDLLQALKNGNQ